jgi:hypothetical protein
MKVCRIQLVLIHRFIELGVDGGYFGDDYGAQKNMLFSPKMWRKYIKPRLAYYGGISTQTGCRTVHRKT